MGETGDLYGHWVPVLARQVQRQGLAEAPLGLGVVPPSERQHPQPPQRERLHRLESGLPAQVQCLFRQRLRSLVVAPQRGGFGQKPEGYARPGRRVQGPESARAASRDPTAASVLPRTEVAVAQEELRSRQGERVGGGAGQRTASSNCAKAH